MMIMTTIITTIMMRTQIKMIMGTTRRKSDFVQKTPKFTKKKLLGFTLCAQSAVCNVHRIIAWHALEQRNLVTWFRSGYFVCGFYCPRKWNSFFWLLQLWFVEAIYHLENSAHVEILFFLTNFTLIQLMMIVMMDHRRTTVFVVSLLFIRNWNIHKL